MKNFTLLAAMAAVALGANAQYQVDPSAQLVLDSEGTYTVDAIVLDDATISAFQAAGYTVNDYRVNDETRFLYVWEGTFDAGDSSYPGVDFQMDGYPSLVVGGAGWSGAGFFDSADAAWDMSNYTENTRLHLAVRSNNAPASIGFIFMDKDGQNTPAKFSVGANFDDNGVIFPALATIDADGEWTGVDLSFGDLKKLWPDFQWTAGVFQGNILSFLAGGVTGKDVSLDAIYIYTPAGEGGVAGIAADNAPVVYYNLQGMRVANPEAGKAYIKVQGTQATKVIK